MPCNGRVGPKLCRGTSRLESMLEKRRLQSVALLNGEETAFQTPEMTGASVASGIIQATIRSPAATHTVALRIVRLKKFG